MVLEPTFIKTGQNTKGIGKTISKKGLELNLGTIILVMKEITTEAKR